MKFFLNCTLHYGSKILTVPKQPQTHLNSVVLFLTMTNPSCACTVCLSILCCVSLTLDKFYFFLLHANVNIYLKLSAVMPATPSSVARCSKICKFLSNDERITFPTKVIKVLLLHQPHYFVQYIIYVKVTSAFERVAFFITVTDLRCQVSPHTRHYLSGSLIPRPPWTTTKNGLREGL